MKTTVTRFAPSPSGYLHLGHIHAARIARGMGDEMRLRIEDIDHTRCKPEYLEAIHDDLAFMGIAHDGDIMVQSRRFGAYAAALDDLKNRELVYPCFLTRKELNDLLSAPHQDGQNITNTDRLIDPGTSAARAGNEDAPAWRLRMEAVREHIKSIDYEELHHGRIAIDLDALGDAVIARKDIATSYHLSVVLDDAAQGITLVSRAEDLAPATPLHRILQQLLGLDETAWHHHGMVLDGDGTRLAKRKNPLTIRSMRESGMGRADILAALEASPKT